MAKKRIDLEIKGVDGGLSNLINKTKKQAIDANKEVSKSMQDPGGVASDAAKQAQSIPSLGGSGVIEVKGIDQIIGLMRELIDVVRNTSSSQINEEKKQAEKDRQKDESEGIQKKDEKKEKRSVFQDIELANMVNNAAQSARGIATAGSATNFVSDGFQTAGSLIGGAANSFSGIPLIGTFIETAIGAVGDAIQKSEESREALFQNESSYRAMSGDGFATNRIDSLRAGSAVGLNNFDSRLNNLGVNMTEATAIAGELAKAQGRRSNQNQVIQSVTAQRGFGIEGQAIQEILKQGRFTEQGQILEELDQTLKSLQKEGIVTEKDRTLFGEVLRSQTQFVDFLSSSQEKVDRKGALDTLLSFNKLGGAFGANDPRSMGKIQSVVGGIQSGGGEYQQALQIDALRKFTPGGNIVDILEAQENIGQNPEQLKAIVDSILQASGSKEAAIMEARNMSGFSELGIADLKRLFSGDFSAVSSEDFKTDTEKMISSTQKLVSVLETQNTQIENAFVESFTKGMATNMDIFGDRMGKALEEALDEAMKSAGEKIKDLIGVDVVGFFEDTTKTLEEIRDFLKPISESTVGKVGAVMGSPAGSAQIMTEMISWYVKKTSPTKVAGD